MYSGSGFLATITTAGTGGGGGAATTCDSLTKKSMGASHLGSASAEGP